MKLALMHVGAQEEVQGLGLANQRRPIGRQFDQPALVELEGGLEQVLFVLGEEVQVLHRAFAEGDRRPDRLGVLTLLLEQLAQVAVLHVERARQGLVGIGVGRDRFDARRGAAADDRDRGGRRDRHLVGEALGEAEFLGVGTGPPFLCQLLRCRISFGAYVFENFIVPDLCHDAFELDQRWLIELAADRTPLVCQSQSLNLFLRADVRQ